MVETRTDRGKDREQGEDKHVEKGKERKENWDKGRYSRRDGRGNGVQQWTEAVGVNSRRVSGSLPSVAALSVLSQNTTWAKTNTKCLLPHRK